MLSWDFAIDEKKNINLIEVNTFGQSIWFPQLINGESFFGENTKYMYGLIKKWNFIVKIIYNYNLVYIEKE